MKTHAVIPILSALSLSSLLITPEAFAGQTFSPPILNGRRIDACAISYRFPDACGQQASQAAATFFVVEKDIIKQHTGNGKIFPGKIGSQI